MKTITLFLLISVICYADSGQRIDISIKSQRPNEIKLSVEDLIPNKDLSQTITWEEFNYYNLYREGVIEESFHELLNSNNLFHNSSTKVPGFIESEFSNISLNKYHFFQFCDTRI